MKCVLMVGVRSTLICTKFWVLRSAFCFVMKGLMDKLFGAYYGIQRTFCNRTLKGNAKTA